MRYELRVLIETGTFLGDMIEAVRSDFERICSIEISKELYDRAKARFRKAKNVVLIHGDSGQALREIVSELEEPALFYLDAHYSEGRTSRGHVAPPILCELDQIFCGEDQRQVILIDDARCFGMAPGYPTIKQIRGFVRRRAPNVDVEVHDDMI